MSAIAIIPARGGSKRIPHKNVKSFLGKPIISYSISAAINSQVFNSLIVSTDDKEIADISIREGALVPFMRSSKNASDTATLTDVLIEVIGTLEKKTQLSEYICCILPTAVFTTPQIIKETHDLICTTNADTVTTVCRYGHPIQRAFIIENDLLKMMHPENAFVRTQDLPITYHDAAQLYWIKVKSFLKSKSLFTKNTVAYDIPEHKVQDIDTINDWKIAEEKYKLFYLNNEN